MKEKIKQFSVKLSMMPEGQICLFGSHTRIHFMKLKICTFNVFLKNSFQ